MTTRLITPPIAEPITFAEAKASIRKDTDAEDALIGSWIVAARRWVEQQTNRSIMRQTRELVLDAFPGDIELFYLPVQAVESITFVNADGVDDLVPSSNYSPDDLGDVLRQRFWIKQAISSDWPEVLANAVDAVRVRYRCGFSDDPDPDVQRAAVPDDIKQTIRFLVGIQDMHRSPLVVGLPIAELPRSLFGGFLDSWILTTQA